MRKKLNKLIACLLVVLFMTELVPFPAFAAEGNDSGVRAMIYTYNSEGTLKRAKRYFSYQSYATIWNDLFNYTFVNDEAKRELQLCENWNLTDTLEVGDLTYDVGIDLNGYNIDRQLTEYKENERALYVNNNTALYSLTIRDTSAQGIGKITGGNTDNGGGLYIKEGRVLLCSGNISGNTAYLGGGVYVSGGGTFVMSGGAVTDNEAKGSSEGGGGIYVFSTGTVSIQGGEVAYNKAHNGGGIYGYARSSLEVGVNGKITNNTAENCGGGIKGDTATIKGTISQNTADLGGGLYINGNATLVGAKITQNTASSAGGGLYVMGDEGHIYDVYLKDGTDITANAGGGVCAAYCKVHLGDEGTNDTVVVKENLDYDLGLSMDSSTLNSKIFSAYTLSEDSQIGICVPGMEDSYTIIDSGNYAQGNLSKLFCDKGGYCLALGDGTSVVMTKGIASYASIPDEYNGKPLLRATFGFSTAAGAMADATAACYYSDGYFMSGDDYSGDPHDYNEHLATMSLAMAMAAFGCNEGGNDYTNKAKHIKQLFSDIGMQDIYLNQFFKEQPSADSMGVAMAHKTLSDGTILLPIALRGANYESEWASNVTIGATGEHKGFSDSATIVFDEVQAYIADNNLDSSKIKFWIAGFSRAGAVSNLTAKRLTQTYDATGNRIFAYTFEAPMGGTKGTTGYTNIKNIVNRNDLVPKVAPSDMGFCRYGEDIMVPYYETVATEYDTARTKMLAQLAAVNSGVVFDDSFNTATIEYMRYIYDMALFKVFENYAGVNFGSPQFVYKDRTSVYKQQWEYLDKFLEKFEYYSLKYRSGFSSTREFYSTGEPWSFETTPTFEDSLRYLVSWLMSMSGDKKSRITSGLITAFSSLPVSDSSDLSLNDIYMDVIGDWAKLRDGQKKDIMGQI